MNTIQCFNQPKGRSSQHVFEKLRNKNFQFIGPELLRKSAVVFDDMNIMNMLMQWLVSPGENN